MVEGIILSSNDTPMIRQYKKIKQNNLDKILFFRVGDFYEMFYDDAEIAARELEITLTSRETGKGNHVPLAGMPYHAADSYIARLIQKGYKVAICEQVEDPKTAKGLVKRDVVRVITPGTLVDQTLLKEKENNYLSSLTIYEDKWGLATIDISTGEFYVTEFTGEKARERIIDEFNRLSPAECVVIDELQNDKLFQKNKNNVLVNYFPKTMLSLTKSKELIKEHFKCFSLTGLGLSDYPSAICSVGVLLDYLIKNHGKIDHLNRIKFYHYNNYMFIDSISRKNLELTKTIKEGKKYGSLLWAIDRTYTAMGGRLIRKWIEQPLINIEKIQFRQNIIEEIMNNITLRNSLMENLKKVYDLERLICRINSGTSNARDLISLKNTLKTLPILKNDLSNSKYLKALSDKIGILDNITNLLEKSIVADPPITLKDGGIIKDKYHPSLDELKEIAYNSRRWIANFEIEEKEKSGIKSLKVRYNKIFGYYIEVTRSNLSLVPERYIRKQTLVNAERFITEELKEKEEIILRSEEKLNDLEYSIFQEIRQKVSLHTSQIQETALILAEIDCLQGLALVSIENRYIRPVVAVENNISIEGGRHPVVEQVLQDNLFVDNDLCLNDETNVVLLTGPNMAGKSTYLRQTALLVLMAQIGCFIPAKKARIGIVDRIFTRVGATDDLVGGHSTFMVEMNEVANIIKHATEKSLIILDEVGRGTSTYDGLSIARATTEYIYKNIKAKTIFATHYHELTTLEDKFAGIKNYNIAVKERGDDIVFLRKVIPGKADRSYGIQVAKLAGLPEELINNSKKILKSLEEIKIPPSKFKKESMSDQLTIFSKLEADNDIKKQILDLDLLTLSPLEIVQQVFEIQKKIKQKQTARG